MPCNQNCNQGRECTCQPDRSLDRATVVIAVLTFICLISVCYGVFNLLSALKPGQDCAVTLQFKNNVKATYIGTSV